MCRPRVQRVASACALTSSLSRSPFLFLSSRDLSFSLPLSCPLFVLRFACSSESLIRRERGDNSSPRLSLDGSLCPPRIPSSLASISRLVTSPNCDSVSLVSVLPTCRRQPEVGTSSTTKMQIATDHRPLWVGHGASSSGLVLFLLLFRLFECLFVRMTEENKIG